MGCLKKTWDRRWGRETFVADEVWAGLNLGVYDGYVGEEKFSNWTQHEKPIG